MGARSGTTEGGFTPMGISRSLRLGAAVVGAAAALSMGAVAPAMAASANGDCGQYCSTYDGSPSGNGSGNGNATGRPAAGSVGNADNKNPQGQFPNGNDANNGYECDGNNGIAKTNPAHTGCTNS